MAYRRNALRRHRVSSAEELGTLKDGDYVKTAGMVIARQRPGTAMGFIFLSMEDETGITVQAVQNRSLGMLKIGKAQDGLRFLAIDSGARLLLHSRWPPCHQTMIKRPLFRFVRIVRHSPVISGSTADCHSSIGGRFQCFS